MSGCAFLPKPIYITSRDKIYIVPRDTVIPILEDGKQGIVKTDVEMILMDRGKYLDLQRELNEALLDS